MPSYQEVHLRMNENLIRSIDFLFLYRNISNRHQTNEFLNGLSILPHNRENTCTGVWEEVCSLCGGRVPNTLCRTAFTWASSSAVSLSQKARGLPDYHAGATAVYAATWSPHDQMTSSRIAGVDGGGLLAVCQWGNRALVWAILLRQTPAAAVLLAFFKRRHPVSSNLSLLLATCPRLLSRIKLGRLLGARRLCHSRFWVPLHAFCKLPVKTSKR